MNNFFELLSELFVGLCGLAGYVLGGWLCAVVLFSLPCFVWEKITKKTVPKKKSFVTILTIVFALIAICSTNLEAIIAENTELQSEITELKSEYSALKSKNSELKRECSDLQSEIEELQAQLNQVPDKLKFYDAYIVFVENDGTNLYHKYECDKFLGEDFWAYNVEQAIWRDYKPCHLCCDD
jgi:cell division protein FtsB